MPSFRFVLDFDAETKDDAADLGTTLEQVAASFAENFPRLKLVIGLGKLQVDVIEEALK